MTQETIDAKVEELRRWERVDADDADAIADLLDALTAAHGYLVGAGIPEADTPLWNMLLRKVAVYFYEVRGPDRQHGYPDLPPDLDHLVLNLRY